MPEQGDGAGFKEYNLVYQAFFTTKYGENK